MPVSAVLLWATARRLPAPAEDPDRPVARPLAPAGAPAPSGTPVEVWQAGKVYPGGVRALDDATFSIAPGERACLLGPNGAGKTTMLRLLVGALAPTRGVVRLFGHTAGEPGFLAAKRRVGVVPQNPGMYRDVTVGEHLRLVQALYGRGDVAEVSRAVGLADVLDRPMAQLSGGMQRRFAIAAALLPKPDLLLLDEPTVGLDPLAANEVHSYLGNVMEGRTTLLCTHNLAEAEDLCDSVVIVRGGRVLVHEPIARLRALVAPEVILRARQGAAALHAELTRLGHAPRSDDDAVAVTLPEPEREVPALLRALLGTGLDVFETRIAKPTLEDLFLRVVTTSAAPDRSPDVLA
jgi:ABC-2 type transport system ATP-binding protein